MPYAAVIASASHAPGLLESIAPSFVSPIATIRNREKEWILESSTFEPYESDEKLYNAANVLLSHIHHILSLYLGRHSETLSVRALLKLTDDDKIIGRRHYWTQKVAVVRPAAQVFNPTPSGSLATAVLSRAATDPAIMEALTLVGLEAPTWPKIYDIIEFLGGPRSIEKSGLAPESESRRMKRTANYYRHLGNPKGYSLPRDPPNIGEGGAFAIALLQKWIAKRL
jgi:hypothetical protein